MYPKVEFLKTNFELEEMDFINLDLERLKKEIFGFYSSVEYRRIPFSGELRNIRFHQASVDFPLARNHLDNCISIIKSLFGIENEHILNASNKLNCKLYSILNENLGVANQRIDKFQEDIESLDKSKLETINWIPMIERFKQTLIHYMDSFVIYTLKESLYKFRLLSKNSVIEKSEELFIWELFKEFYNIAEIEGNVARKTRATEFRQIIRPDTMRKNYPQNTEGYPTQISDSDANINEDVFSESFVEEYTAEDGGEYA